MVIRIPAFAAAGVLLSLLAACIGLATAGGDPALFPPTIGSAGSIRMSDTEVHSLREKVREMFYHGYDSYLKYAFPHDELKPLSGSWTDSLGELGNAQLKKGTTYRGVALTMIDSLSTLAVMGNRTEFTRAVRWLESNLNWDIDVRVNVFECNIRVLGGLLSAHVLADDTNLDLMGGTYTGGLLTLAHDLGRRLMSAFRGSQTAIPLAWVNLRHGVEPGETRDQCTAGVGTLLLEFGLLSHLTGDSSFVDAADRAMNRLWELKSEVGLFGNTLDADSLQWKNPNSGIGAGIDSFYEYLLKASVMFGNSKYLHMFNSSYTAVNKHLKWGNHWYVEGEMANGRHTHVQFNSLQAFWPGLQVLYGDLEQAIPTQDAFYSLWQRFSGLPERFVLNANQVHNTERYYPLRPEFIESTYYLYTATQHPYYLTMGKNVYESLMNVTRVPMGFASVQNVESGALEDHMHSFFLAETCKYLYLLFDPNNFVHQNKRELQSHAPPASASASAGEATSLSAAGYLFTTEGHLFPILHAAQRSYGDGTPFARFPTDSRSSRENKHLMRRSARAVCPLPAPKPSNHTAVSSKSRSVGRWLPPTEFQRYITSGGARRTTPPAAAPPVAGLEQCPIVQPQPALAQSAYGDFHVTVGDGSFQLKHRYTHEIVDVRNLGSPVVEIVNRKNKLLRATLLDTTTNRVINSRVRMREPQTCTGDLYGVGALFAPAPKDSGSSASNDVSGAVAVPRSAATEELELQWRAARISAGESWLRGEIVATEPQLACSPVLNGASLAGRIALVSRGQCTFMDKVIAAQTAGAIGVVITNDQDTNPDNIFLMGGDMSGREATVKIPATMIGASSAARLRACIFRQREKYVASQHAQAAAAAAAAEDSSLAASYVSGLTAHEFLRVELLQTEYDGTASESKTTKSTNSATATPTPPPTDSATDASIAPPPPAAVAVPPAADGASGVATDSKPRAKRRRVADPRISGNQHHFLYTALGKWKLEIEAKDGNFLLRLP